MQASTALTPGTRSTSALVEEMFVDATQNVKDVTLRPLWPPAGVSKHIWQTLVAFVLAASPGSMAFHSTAK